VGPGQPSPRPEKKKKKGLLSGTIRGAREKVESATGFILPDKHDIEETLGMRNSFAFFFFFFEI
jgi:hypothetical protein